MLLEHAVWWLQGDLDGQPDHCDGWLGDPSLVPQGGDTLQPAVVLSQRPQHSGSCVCIACVHVVTAAVYFVVLLFFCNLAHDSSRQ